MPNEDIAYQINDEIQEREAEEEESFILA